MNGPKDPKDLKREGPAKFIGGYATGNLPDREREQLLEASLHDQDLFNALMEEQALKDLLDQPGIKRELIEALQPKVTWLGRIRQWLATPIAFSTAGAVAASAVLLMVIFTRPPYRESPAQTARQKPAMITTPAEPRREPPAPALSRAPDESKLNKKREVAAPPPELAHRPEMPPAPAVVEQPKKEDSAIASEQERRAEGLSVEYGLLKRTAGGGYQPVSTNAVRSEDALRLQVTSGTDGFLTLYKRDTIGNQIPIVNSQAVSRGQSVAVPSQGFFTIGAGVQNLILIVAQQPQMNVESPGAMVQGQAVRRRNQVADLADSNDRKAVLPSPKTLRATAPAASNSGQLVVEISIRNQ
ncbi:MAG TPA: hypothetical protein VM120_14900 [Bryobacteraceae bacterium]|nr:hypothetical protein [Bryobacteraceae bacterium]